LPRLWWPLLAFGQGPFSFLEAAATGGDVQNQGATINEPRINERIRVPEVRLVGPQGEQVGIVRIEDAMRLAQESDLDLVEVAPDARPPVAKLMDYGKYKYEAAVKAREARRNQVNTEIKEMRFGLKIDEHDYETKKGHVIRFLKGGDKVKLTVQFRGREQSRPEIGRRMLLKLAEEVAEFAVVENMPSQEGRRMSIVLGPLKKKAEAKEEQRRERKAREAEARDERAAKRAPKAGPGITEENVADAVAGDAGIVDGETASVAVSADAESGSAFEVDTAVEADTGVDADTAVDPEAAPAKPAAKAAAKPAAAKPAAKAAPKAPASGAAKPVAAKPTAAAKPGAVKPVAPKAPASTAKPAAKPAAAKPATAKPKPAPKATD
jgi:translation initiation factor IF-3